MMGTTLIRHTLVAVSFLTGTVAAATPLQMVLLENHMPLSADKRINVETRILPKLQQIALPEIQIEPKLLSNPRAWEMLRQPGNYCALNKVHTPERETFLYFAKLPTSVYPPLQLLSTRPLSDQPVDLGALLQQHPELKIGVVSGRSYNARIDALIKQYPQQFYQRSGDDAAENLALMLGKKRLDAVIEFAAIVRASLKKQGLNPTIIGQQLQGVALSRGFIVCNKSALGLQMIRLLDQKMQDQQYQADLVRYHREFFSASDYALIHADLMQYFSPQ